MKTITIDISSILYWILLIYIVFNLITILIDSIDGDLYKYSLIQRLNPFRHGSFEKYYSGYFIIFIMTILLSLLINWLIITPILTHHFEFIW